MDDHEEVLTLANKYHNTPYKSWCHEEEGNTMAVELLLDSGYLEIKDGILLSRYR